MPSKLEYSLEAVNQRLKASRLPVSLRVRGGQIWVQGTFPPKPGSDRPRAYQQRFSLKQPINEEGFKKAEKEAGLIGAELVNKAFRWEKYLSPDRLPESKPCRLWIEEFQEYYLARHSMKPSTWKGDWLNIYKRLPQDEPLTVGLMVKLIYRTERDTRDRKETCGKFQKLADFAKLDADFLELKGTYGPSKVKARDIPSDETIAAQWSKIQNPGWRWVYGMMAACGLRDHEVFFCEWTDEGLQVLKGKTGPRLVFQPLYPEWVEAWDLRNVVRPNIQDADDLYAKQQLGTKVARAFNRQNIPFSPYNLRHAFGFRAAVTFEIQVPTAAALMGHSPKIHMERYHKHTKLQHHIAAVKRIMQRPDCPRAPILTDD